MTTLTGGCQCGAIRYAIHSEPRNPHLCHCRMCQKAFGGFFAPLAGGIPKTDFEVTRGTLGLFRSSDEAERGFCAACGTPLTFAYFDSKYIAVAIGSLDTPEVVRPVRQYSPETRIGWLYEMPTWPEESLDGGPQPERLEHIRRTNHQHPDHDTETWPPA